MKVGDLIKITDYRKSFRYEKDGSWTFIKPNAPPCLIVSLDKNKTRLLASWNGEFLIAETPESYTDWYEIIAENKE